MAGDPISGQLSCFGKSILTNRDGGHGREIMLDTTTDQQAESILKS